ncbi:MAG: hypothetical protein KJ666_17190 [Bacteroidetes bacterium]|nr:hypothetical protein [Bacteroidota bacterium]
MRLLKKGIFEGYLPAIFPPASSLWVRRAGIAMRQAGIFEISPSADGQN